MLCVVFVSAVLLCSVARFLQQSSFAGQSKYPRSLFCHETLVPEPLTTRLFLPSPSLSSSSGFCSAPTHSLLWPLYKLVEGADMTENSRVRKDFTPRDERK